jgi:hypothetical protein
LAARLGPLPRTCATWARLAARQAVDLEALAVELDAARVAGRRKQAAGLRHRIARGTARLLALETRIEHLVRPGATPAQTDEEILAAVRRLRGEEAQ